MPLSPLPLIANPANETSQTSAIALPAASRNAVTVAATFHGRSSSNNGGHRDLAAAVESAASRGLRHLLLGQAIALLVGGTGFFSELLSMRHGYDALQVYLNQAGELPLRDYVG